jgi:hypothetical protein
VVQDSKGDTETMTYDAGNRETNVKTNGNLPGANGRRWQAQLVELVSSLDLAEVEPQIHKYRRNRPPVRNRCGAPYQLCCVPRIEQCRANSGLPNSRLQKEKCQRDALGALREQEDPDRMIAILKRH